MMANSRTLYLIVSCLVLNLSLISCDDTVNSNLTDTTNVTSQGHRKVCNTLLTCVRIGVLTGLEKIEKSDVFQLLGNRFVLEKNLHSKISEDVDISKMNMLKRAYRILDTHSARAVITKSFALKLFRTPQGPFDVALEVSAPSTARDGNNNITIN